MSRSSSSKPIQAERTIAPPAAKREVTCMNVSVECQDTKVNLCGKDFEACHIVERVRAIA